MSKVILVTGSNTGIGFELVRLLAEKGHSVYLAARNEHSGKVAVYVYFIIYGALVILINSFTEISCTQTGSQLLNLCALM